MTKLAILNVLDSSILGSFTSSPFLLPKTSDIFDVGELIVHKIPPTFDFPLEYSSMLNFTMESRKIPPPELWLSSIMYRHEYVITSTYRSTFRREYKLVKYTLTMVSQHLKICSKSPAKAPAFSSKFPDRKSYLEFSSSFVIENYWLFKNFQLFAYNNELNWFS